MKSRIAYTLVEVIVVIAILGIIVAMTIPNSGYFKAIKESLEIKELKRDILFARNKAVVDCKKYGIEFNVKSNSYRIYTSSDCGPEDIKIKYFEHGTKLSTRSGAKGFIFNPNGSTTDSGRVYFYDRLGQEYELIVTPVSCKVNIKKNI